MLLTKKEERKKENILVLVTLIFTKNGPELALKRIRFMISTMISHSFFFLSNIWSIFAVLNETNIQYYSKDMPQ